MLCGADHQYPHLKQALGAAPAGVLLAGFLLAPNCHIEWTRAHPERREKDNVKWSYRDWESSLRMQRHLIIMLRLMRSMETIK
jgi:hypothetical protein